MPIIKLERLKALPRRTLLIAGTAGILVLGAGGALVAQARHAPLNPARYPAVQGTVAQYDLSPRGDVDGLILADGTEVRFPPHLGTAVQGTVRPGDAVTVRGPKTGTVLRAASVANAAGDTVVDRRPAKPPAPRDRVALTPMEETGTVKMALHGPRGEVNGALLDSGTLVHLPPREASRMADALKPGQPLAVRGDGVAGPTGKAIAARAIGPSMDKLTPIAAPPPPPAGPGPGPGPGPRPPAPRPA